MNEKIVFVRTDSGEDEARSRTAHLSKDIKRALLMVDGTASVAEILKRSSPSLRGMLEDMFLELERGGFIQDKARIGRPAKLVTPAAAKKSADEVDELDFTAAYRAPTPAMLAEEAAKQELKARQASEETERVKAALAAAEARLKAEALSAKEAQEAAELARREAESVKAQAMRQARELAERHAKREVEAARQKAAEEKARAEEEERVRLEEAKAEARAELQARLLADTAKAQAEREAREAEQAKQRAAEDALHAEAEEKARREAALALEEAAKAHERELAERHARELAEQKQREAEEKLRAAEENSRREFEAARLQAEQIARELANQHAKEAAEAARLAEAAQQALRLKAEEEARARAIADENARMEAEVAQLKAKLEARAQAEEEARLAEKAARELAEQQARELEARLLAEQTAARELAERHARELAEQKLREEEEKSRAAEQEKARIEQARAEAQAKAQAEEQARLDAERVRAEQEAAQALEAAVAEEARQAKEALEATRRARQQAAEARAEAAAQARARAAAEEKTQMQIELARLQAQIDAESRAHIEAEEREKAIKAEQEARAAEELRAAQSKNGQSEVLASVVKLNDKHSAMEQSVFAALENLAQQEAQEEQGAEDLAGQLLAARKTTIAAVVIFDIVDYSTHSGKMQIALRQQLDRLLARNLKASSAGERVQETVDEGVAIGFLQQPTDALEAAMHCHNQLMTDKYNDYPDLRLRIGIHLGPVSLAQDAGGTIRMSGEGVASAQRVVGVAASGELCVSRAYFDFVSSLSGEYDDLFRYRCAQQDKLGRELHVYELLLDGAAEEAVKQHAEQPEIETAVKPAEKSNGDAFNFDAFDLALSVSAPAHAASSMAFAALTGSVLPSAPEPRPETRSSAASQLLNDAVALRLMEDIKLDLPIAQPLTLQPSVQPVLEQPEVSEPLYSEDESRHLAAIQEKKWAEAEQRAAIEPRLIAAPRAEVPRVEAPPQPRAVKRRVPWGKLAAGCALLLVLLLFAVPALLPTQGYVSAIEQRLGAALQQPVHIGQMTGRILPTPRIVLSEVSVGETKQIQVRQAQADFGFAALFGQLKAIENMNLDGVKVQGAALSAASAWLQKTAADPLYPVARLTLTQGVLEQEGMQFNEVEGAILFDTSGKFSQADLGANGKKMALEIRALQSGLQLNLTLRDSAPPLFPNWVFDELKAKGELGGDELILSELDGRIRGGVLTGDARIGWRSGWQVQGVLNAKVIPLQNINKLLVGDLDGNARFQMKAGGVAGLADSAVLNGSFSVKKGTLNGVDVVETARLRSRENLPGGRTHFEEMSGELAYQGGHYHFHPLRITDKVVKVYANIAVDQQVLSGNVTADLAMRGGTAALQAGGTTDSPTLHLAH